MVKKESLVREAPTGLRPWGPVFSRTLYYDYYYDDYYD